MTDNPTMQDVLRKFYPKYLEMHTPNEHQAKAVRHILNCKTGAYGANISKCEKCGHAQYHNNSCRDRSCPMFHCDKYGSFCIGCPQKRAGRSRQCQSYFVYSDYLLCSRCCDHQRCGSCDS